MTIQMYANYLRNSPIRRAEHVITERSGNMRLNLLFGTPCNCAIFCDGTFVAEMVGKDNKLSVPGILEGVQPMLGPAGRAEGGIAKG
jgi:hypothetical protein